MESNTGKFHKSFTHQLSAYQNLGDITSAGYFVPAIFWPLSITEKHLSIFGSWIQKSNNYSIFEIPYKMNFSKEKCHCSSGVLGIQSDLFSHKTLGGSV